MQEEGSMYCKYSRSSPYGSHLKTQTMQTADCRPCRPCRPCRLSTFFLYPKKSTNNPNIEMIDSLDFRHPLESSLCLFFFRTCTNSPSVFPMAFHPRQNSWFVSEVHHMNFTLKLKFLYCYLVFYMLHQGFNMRILYLSFKLYIHDYH